MDEPITLTTLRQLIFLPKYLNASTESGHFKIGKCGQLSVVYPIWLRGIPYSDLVDTIRAHVQEARQHNRIYEIN